MMIAQYGNHDASTVLVQMVDDHDLEGIEKEATSIQKLTGTDFCLTAVKVQNWNNDLSPWPAPAVFGSEGFGGGAAGTLAEILQYFADRDKTYIIGGYSLAGLFALWAVYQTDIFSAVAAASPSIWFPDFTEYMKDRRPSAEAIYLSLGNKEEKTRNPVMATVGDKIREAHGLLEQQKIVTTLEWNQGNHFKDPDIRTANAFAWTMKQVCRVLPTRL